ncbi:MAG: S8 family serine peptidase [Fimbriimonadales bacterium]|nr:S8 family serine peptidase [Fimbriimonadales bacterium]
MLAKRIRSSAAIAAVSLAAIAPSQTTTNVPALLELAERLQRVERTQQLAIRLLAPQLWQPAPRELPNGAVFQRFWRFPGWDGVYVTCNLNAARTINADKVWPGGSAGLALTGSGIDLGVWDSGSVRTTHREFGSRAQNIDGVAHHWHATHVGGTMAAAGVDPSAKGMSFEASLLSLDWNSDSSEMATRAAGGLRVSNHSYSVIYDNGANWNYGFYDPEAQTWDQIAFDAPFYTIVKSAGNDQSRNTKGGYDTIPTSGTAKNILTIGAVSSISGGYSGPSSVVMSNFSSWGPTDDGRIKPDLVTPGVNLYSTFNTSDSAYAVATGTSMAAPVAAGAVGLLVRHQRNLQGGQDLRSSTMKALLIATANEAGPADGPDYRFGWGLLDVRRAAEVLTANASTPGIVREDALSNGEAKSYFFQSNGSPVRVALAWTDRPGTVSPYATNDPTDLRLVNDLDLRVFVNGVEWLPWVLNPASPAANATRGDNFRDNVERVDVPSPGAATVEVRVTHKGSLAGGSQAFGLVVLGLTPAAPVRVSALSLNPTQVVGGGSSTGTVTLTGPAPSGGAVVSIASSNPPVASAPATVTVPAGATQASFTVATSSVTTATDVRIEASYGGGTASADLRVLPEQALTGTGELQDFSGDRTQVDLTLEIRNPGTTTVVQSLSFRLGSSGGFRVVASVAPGTYDLAIKGGTWLRKVLRNVSVGANGAAGLSFSLPNGDCNGDNVINLADLNLISAAWRSQPGSSNWDPRADLNGDLRVNLLDRNIVSKNWRLRGDP